MKAYRGKIWKLAMFETLYGNWLEYTIHWKCFAQIASYTNK